MKETTTKPTVEGWYFIRYPNHPSRPDMIMFLCFDNYDKFYWEQLNEGVYNDPEGTRYVGPITEPQWR